MKTCLIFDVDDTLIKYEKFDFKEWYRFIAEPVAKKLGISMDVKIWRKIIEGKISRRYPEKFGINAVKFWKMIDERNLEYRKNMLSLGKLRKYEDAEVIKSLPGFKIAWSSSSEECIKFVLENTKLLDFFDFVVGKDYENYSHIDDIKPRGGILREVLNKLRCEKCYVIGDSRRDMMAASNAGCMGILLSRDGGEKSGDIVIESLWELENLISG